MRRKNLWLRVSSCTMAALLATTSAAPVSAADFTSEIVMEDQQDEASAEVETEEPVIEEETQDEASAEVTEDTAEADFAEADETEFADTYEAADFADSAEAVSDGTEETAQTGFGTANTVLAKGTYTVPASLKNASDTSRDSMAASCIAGNATMEVAEDGSAKVTVPIQKVTVYGMTSGATDWKIYKGDLKSETTDAEFTADENGDVTSITFTVPDKAADGVYVKMTVALMGSSVDAFLKLDYANAQTVAPAVDTAVLEITIAKADALEENAYTKASWDANKEAIDAANTAAKAAMEAKESQEAVDAANTALTDAMAKLAEAGDPTALQEALNQAKALNETDYTVKSWNYLAKYITEAETRIADRDTAKNMKRTTSNLNFYMGRLDPKYDTTKLEAKIAEAKALNKDDYTADSWKEASIASAVSAAEGVISARDSKEQAEYAYDNLVNAMDKLVKVANEVTVGRGNFQKKLAPGTYSLPIELLNGGHSEATQQYTSGDYMTHTSMAAGCFTGNATLTIHEDGSATLTTGVQAITAMGMTGAASDWTIYENTQDYLDGKANSKTGARFKARVDASKVQAGKKKPSQISFTVPDLKQNVVASNMYIEVMSVNQDACIGLDWTNVEKISDETSATSTVEKEYVVKADTMTQLNNMKAGTTVTLDEDVTLTEDLVVKGGTIDLNGHALNQANNLIRIKGDVTIIDSSEGKTGKITSEAYATSATSYTESTIAVQRGSLTAEGITIDGQIGNCVYNNSSVALQNDNKVSVTLKNCTLSNSRGKATISFQYLEKGVDLVVDGCSTGQIKVGYGKDETTSITNTTVSGTMDVSGVKATVKNVKVDSARISSSLGADDMTIEDSEFTALRIYTTKDMVLESVNIRGNDEMNADALTVSGSGQVTVKAGVFESLKSYAIASNGVPVSIEGGYFKGKSGSINGAYVTPEGKVLGDVTEGDYAGYQTLVDGVTPDVETPVATIYNEDGSVAKQISEENTELALTYAKSGQTVKLNADIEVDALNFYKDCTLDLNGHTIKEENGINGNAGTCRVIDSSEAKTGKIVGEYYIFNGNAAGASMILDNATAEAAYAQGISVGSMYIINGSRMNNVVQFNAVMGGGITYVRDSICTVAEAGLDGTAPDPQEVMENGVRTSQYTLTKTGDRTYTVTANDLGKAMRAFEAIDASQYTKASYAAAKAVYDEIDGSADEDIQGDVIAQKAQELNAAIAALVTPASESDIKALTDAVAAAKKLASADYTAASYKTLTDAIVAAEKVLAGEEASAEEVAAAAKALEDANAKLVKLASQTITATASYNKKYGDKAFSLGAKAKTALTYKSSNTKIATVDKYGKVTIKGVGTVNITIEAAANANYKKASKTVTIKVARGTQAISGTKTSYTTTFGSKAFSLGAKASGKLTYKSSNTKIAVVDKYGKVTAKGVGTVKITISAASTSVYNAAGRTVTVKVNKAAPTIRVKKASADVRYANLKNRAQVFYLGASVNSNGRLVCKKISGSSAIGVASNGRIVVKKGIKKGTYKATVRVYAGARGNYNGGIRTVGITVRVR